MTGTEFDEGMVDRFARRIIGQGSVDVPGYERLADYLGSQAMRQSDRAALTDIAESDYNVLRGKVSAAIDGILKKQGEEMYGRR